MTIRCPACDCVDMQLIDHNGAQYPQTRRERYECADCGREKTVVLSA